MSKQTDTQGETTFNQHDKHPHRKKVQRAKEKVPIPTKTMTITIAPKGRKYVYSFERRYPRKNLPLSERSQVTKGEFVYKKSKSQYPPLYGKWHKYRKGDNRILDTVDSLPTEVT